MAIATAVVERGEIGFKKTAKEFGVPKTTLKRRCKDVNKHAKGTAKILGRFTVSIAGGRGLVYAGIFASISP